MKKLKRKTQKVSKFSFLKLFQEFIPYGEPKWLQGYNSPYYNESHFKFCKIISKFSETELLPNTFEWEDIKKEVPKSFRKKCGDNGILSCLFGKWPKEYTKEAEILSGMKPEEFNYFHELILIDQMSKCASFGVLGNIFVTHTIGLSPVLNFASKYLQDKVAPPCLSGEKMICLAITEPHAGSDVANIKATAKKSEDGKFYILNGEKKYITK
jgi:alkylation response protein AidB-like acyl-CoA dehydrogenase